MPRSRTSAAAPIRSSRSRSGHSISAIASSSEIGSSASARSRIPRVGASARAADSAARWGAIVRTYRPSTPGRQPSCISILEGRLGQRPSPTASAARPGPAAEPLPAPDLVAAWCRAGILGVFTLRTSSRSPECRYHILGEALEILKEERRHRHEDEVGHSGLAVAFYGVQALLLVADHDLLACFLGLLAAHRTDDRHHHFLALFRRAIAKPDHHGLFNFVRVA